jgi:hypothetical protein
MLALYLLPQMATVIPYEDFYSLAKPGWLPFAVRME